MKREWGQIEEVKICSHSSADLLNKCVFFYSKLRRDSSGIKEQGEFQNVVKSLNVHALKIEKNSPLNLPALKKMANINVYLF